jgi:TolB-like protein
MTPERWHEVTDLYHVVREAEPSRRAALLETADSEVRLKVELLLRGDDSAPDPLDRNVLSDAAALLERETETKTLLAEGASLGPYQVQALLGRGGMGEVYRAHDSKLGRDVAIKTLPKGLEDEPERVARFRREARILASLNHPNIAAIYGVEEWGGLNFMILELVEGETLAERLKRTGLLPLDETLRIMSEVGAALEAAHRKSIVHRDIKPSNIKITPEGRVKVLDVGLAKVLRPTATAPGTDSSAGLDTEQGRILGTPRYMSPEQARGQEVDWRTDIWAFGCVLYELLTGRCALTGETVSDILVSILEREPDYEALPHRTPLQLRRLIQQCLNKDRDARFGDISEARSLLEEGRERPRRPAVTRRGLAIASAIVMAAAVSVAFNAGGLRDLWFAGSPRIRSIAVLPLANLSGSPDQEYFSDGMTESLITDLARIGALKVISRTSVMRYKGTKQPVREIARELKVDAVLEGSAVRSGNRIRITAKLIDARTDEPLWAASYNRDFADVLALQSELARAIAQQVHAQLTPQERKRFATTKTVIPEVHEAYLQGMYQWYRGGYDASQRLFELVLAKDPRHARAYAGIARVWTARSRDGLTPPAEARPKAMAALQRALALDNTLAEIHTALATSQGWAEWDWVGAEAEYRRAIELDPNDAEARAGHATVLNILKRPSEAMAEIERALELDSYNPWIRGSYASNLNFAFRYAEAEAEARRVLAVNPGHRSAMAALRIAVLRQRRYKEVLEIHRDNFATRGFPQIARVLQRGYEQGKYREAFEEAARMFEVRWEQGSYVQIADIAALYDEAERPEKSLDWWEKGAERHDANMPAMLLTLPQGSVRADNPRFQAILRRVGFPTGASIYQTR